MYEQNVLPVEPLLLSRPSANAIPPSQEQLMVTMNQYHREGTKCSKPPEEEKEKLIGKARRKDETKGLFVAVKKKVEQILRDSFRQGIRNITCTGVFLPCSNIVPTHLLPTSPHLIDPNLLLLLPSAKKKKHERRNTGSLCLESRIPRNGQYKHRTPGIAMSKKTVKSQPPPPPHSPTLLHTI